MNNECCHSASPRDEVKAIVLDVLGVKRVADWCGVTPAAVWQWLSRSTNDQPFPIKHAPKLLAGARAAGLAFDEGPFMRVLGLESQP